LAAKGDTRRGLIVAVIGSAGRGQEMLVAIARRRFAADASVEFPGRMTTRSGGQFAGETTISRRVFAEMEGAGAFLATWEAGGHSHGLAQSAAAALCRGRTLVLAVEDDAVARLSAAWPAMRAVVVRSGPDVLRAAPGQLVVDHRGDLAEAAVRFHALLATLRREQLEQCTALPRAEAGGRALRRLVSDPPLGLPFGAAAQQLKRLPRVPRPA